MIENNTFEIRKFIFIHMKNIMLCKYSAEKQCENWESSNENSYKLSDYLKENLWKGNLKGNIVQWTSKLLTAAFNRF